MILATSALIAAAAQMENAIGYRGAWKRYPNHSIVATMKNMAAARK